MNELDSTSILEPFCASMPPPSRVAVQEVKPVEYTVTLEAYALTAAPYPAVQLSKELLLKATSALFA